MIDFTNYLEISEQYKKKTVVCCFVRLDKETMLNALKSESIYIRGYYFKVPETKLLHLLLNKQFGETYLELEKIE